MTPKDTMDWEKAYKKRFAYYESLDKKWYVAGFLENHIKFINDLLSRQRTRILKEEKKKWLNKLDKVISGEKYVCKNCGEEYEMQVHQGVCAECLGKYLDSLDTLEKV